MDQMQVLEVNNKPSWSPDNDPRPPVIAKKGSLPPPAHLVREKVASPPPANLQLVKLPTKKPASRKAATAIPASPKPATAKPATAKPATAIPVSPKANLTGQIVLRQPTAKPPTKPLSERKTYPATAAPPPTKASVKESGYATLKSIGADECNNLMCEAGIKDKKEAMQWLIKHHPDKGGEPTHISLSNVTDCMVK
jgi:hypothetical protein